ncbi:S9 family peptidase [Nocardioides sp. Arc9.136]|uniref:alpha/beta hydrolase family protein n=1 Tax=Nocardioides sp. Arc9.136 TaxID=2996826 RepID=UPI002666C036|nr:alpha/beta fold hydrolase [Nocardioides sp. Arc9.136]WKN50318.1 alpha/beta fold hydrolase [Nocardioides sp. Arc9.136]
MRLLRRPAVRAAALVLGVAPVAVGTLAATGASYAAPAPEAARTAPQPSSTELPRGSLLTHRPLRTAAALPSARRTELVTYMSKGVGGQSVVVSGTVALPTTRPPAGGWPVLSWAHGTTGTADECAPSADRVGGPAHDYLGRVDETLDRWVDRGYVVVQTDYEGLGTPGDHPYINGASARRSVEDIVRAARRLDRRVGRDYVAAGHSQGGHAALFTGGSPGKRTDIRLRGVVAIAPGGVGLSQTAPYIQSNQPGADQALGFLPPLLLGAEAGDPTIDASAWVTAEGERLLAAGRTGCLGDIREVAAGIKAVDVFRPDVDLSALGRYLRRQELPGPRLRVPTMIAQGTADTAVGKPGVDQLVSSLCGAGADVTYRVYEGADHRAAVETSYADAAAFARTVLKGGKPAGTCD